MTALDAAAAALPNRSDLTKIKEEAVRALHCNVSLYSEGRLAALDVGSLLSSRGMQCPPTVAVGVERRAAQWCAFLRRDGAEETIGVFGSAKAAAAAVIHVQQQLLHNKTLQLPLVEMS